MFRDFSGAGHASIEHKQDRLKSVEVEKITIDSFSKIHRIEEVAFMKLDVERHELKVLMGAETLRRKARPLWLLKYHWREIEKYPWFKFLEKLGYDGFCFAENEICHYSRLDQLTKTGGRGSFVFGPAEFMKQHTTRIAGKSWLPGCASIC